LDDSDLNTPTAFSFLGLISYIKNSEGDINGEFDVNKKIVKLISANKVKVEEQPQWVRMGYLKLLSKSVAPNEKIKAEIIKDLRKVFKEKGNVFVLNQDSQFSDIEQREKQFLELIQK
jgi:hypothetical protein